MIYQICVTLEVAFNMVNGGQLCIMNGFGWYIDAYQTMGLNFKISTGNNTSSHAIMGILEVTKKASEYDQDIPESHMYTTYQRRAL